MSQWLEKPPHKRKVASSNLAGPTNILINERENYMEPQVITCRKCSNCCRNTTVVLDEQDIANIRKHVGNHYEFFRIRKTGAKILNWKQHYENNVCIFLDPFSNQCEIYPFRPAVCKQYSC